VGLTPATPHADGFRGAWLLSHIALSFVGIAAFATAGASGLMYLFQRRELKAAHFGATLRFFPPLATLDRVNHVSAIAGWLALTVGVVLAASYAITYHEPTLLHLVWAVAAWAAVTCIALGRVALGWQARRAAMYSSVAFATVLVFYVALRLVAGLGSGTDGRFL
jgi:ABC-type uncharacterized transport system permease subunit